MQTTKMFDESKEYLASFYKNIGDLKSDYRNWNLYNLLMSMIKEGSHLDVGCGPGHFLSFAMKNGNECFGLEPNTELLEHAKGLYPGINIYNLVAEDIDKTNRNFDNISMLDVLEHIEDDESILQKLYSRLNVDGNLILVVPAHRFLYGMRDKNLGHYRRYTKNEIVKKVGNAGFKIENVRFWNMAGVLPYYLSEKVLRKELRLSSRANKNKNFLNKVLNRLIFNWVKYVENNISMGMGLSLIILAKKND